MTSKIISDNITKIKKHLTGYSQTTIVISAILLVALLWFVVHVILNVYGSMHSGFSQGDSYRGGATMNNVAMDYDSAAQSEMAMIKSGRENMTEYSIGIPPQPPFIEGESSIETSINRIVVKNGSLSLQVENIDQVRNQISLVAAQNNGFVSYENFSQYESDNQSQRRSGNMTLRVPIDSYEQVMGAIRGTALVVTNDQTNTDDITEQYADLETRLQNKRAEVDQYRALLAQASDVSDILEVTKYLNTAQSESERLQGQLNVLSNRATMSTISVYLESEQSVAVWGVTWNPWQEAVDAVRSLTQGLLDFAGFVLFWVIQVPLVLLYAFVIYGAVKLFMISIEWISNRKKPKKNKSVITSPKKTKNN